MIAPEGVRGRRQARSVICLGGGQACGRPRAVRSVNRRANADCGDDFGFAVDELRGAPGGHARLGCGRGELKEERLMPVLRLRKLGVERLQHLIRQAAAEQLQALTASRLDYRGDEQSIQAAKRERLANAILEL